MISTYKLYYFHYYSLHWIYLIWMISLNLLFFSCQNVDIGNINNVLLSYLSGILPRIYLPQTRQKIETLLTVTVQRVHRTPLLASHFNVDHEWFFEENFCYHNTRCFHKQIGCYPYYAEMVDIF